MVQDASAWLRAQGLEKYLALFTANEIDAETLPALTEDHLRELGLPMGPRVKLLKALASLNAQPQPPTPAEPAPPATAPAAERRQLTVLFVDLVGSTALSAELDPEDLRLIVRNYQACVATEVARWGGHVAQYMGDGVLAYFGYPVAHEGETERAARAALAIVAAVAALPQPALPRALQLAVRVGLASGLVVVGDLLGAEGLREPAIVGETPNLAARLQALAEPGQIILSAQTAELVGSVFELTALGPQRAPGWAEPVAAWRLGAERLLSKLESSSGEQLGAMVGRDHELAMLLERWHTATTGDAQLVVLTGDAGIGKSRITRALQDALQNVPHARIKLQCSPYHSDTALHPSIQHLRLSAGIRSEDPVDTQLDRLEASLAWADAKGLQDAPVLAAMLGIPAEHRYGPLGLQPHELRQKTFEALINQSRLLAGKRPLLVVFEDAHWMDPTTLEMVSLFVERLAKTPTLMLVTARSGFKHSFGEQCDISSIVLNRLGRAQIGAVARRVAGGKSLPESLLREIAAKTDGVPLFAEEFTKSLLESGALKETAAGYVFDEQAGQLVVPASLHDSLMARLDRLHAVKEVAQTAACIGREFEPGLLAEVLPMGPESAQAALDQLVVAELVSKRGQTPHVRYAFKHALVRDAAYGSLLRARRQQIHARLAAVLQGQPHVPPEVLAHHAQQAGQLELAVQARQQAAQQAMARPAYKEASAHLEQAITMAQTFGQTPPWPQRHLQLQLLLVQALIPLRGYGHPETLQAVLQARAMASAQGAIEHRFAIAYALWVVRYVRAEQDEALRIAREMLEWARQDQHRGNTVSALRSLAISQLHSGDPVTSVSAFDEALQLAGPALAANAAKRRGLADRFAADPIIASQVHQALMLWSLGHVRQDAQMMAEALADARAMGHAHTLALTLSHAAIHAFLNGDAGQAQALGAEAVAVAEGHELEMFKGYGLLLQGCGMALRGQTAEAAAWMAEGIGFVERTQTGALVAILHAVQARNLARLGRFEEAEHHAERVHRELSKGSERIFWPECHRLLGDYLGLCPGVPISAVQARYQQALDTAQAQQSASFALYAATSLARCHAQQGRPEPARALLAQALAPWSAEDRFAAHDEALALLQQIDAGPWPAPSE